MATVISKFYTPENNSGNRDIIHPETEMDAVVDPANNKTLPTVINEIKSMLVLADTALNRNGFLSATDKKQYDEMLQSKVYVSEGKPDQKTGCIWMHVLDVVES